MRVLLLPASVLALLLPLTAGAATLGLSSESTGGSGPTEPLVLDDVLAQVDRNYPKLLGAEVERQIAGAKALAKAGAFDPELSLKREELQYVSGTTEFQKEKTDLVVDVPTRSGIKWFFGARQSDTTQVGKSGIKEFDRGYVGLEIPLVRDARINAKFAAERQAQLEVPLAEAAQRQRRLEVLQSAGEAYWMWVAAAQARSVAAGMMELAELRAAAVREQVDRGDQPELVAVEAAREVQKRRGQLAKAERNLQKAGLKLSLYLWSDDGEPQDPPDPGRAPTRFPELESMDPAEVRLAEARALRQRPELDAVDVQREIVDIDLDLARNDGRPGVKLFVNPGRSSVVDVFEPIERQLRAGLKFTVPLRRRGPTGRAQAARLKQQKLRMMRELLRQQIRVEVRDAASRIWTDLERLQAAAGELDLARRLEQGERESFALGAGTLFLVNTRERYRADAELKRIDVASDYQTARLGFRAVSGDL